MTIENNIKKLNIVLPKAADPVGSYVATKISGKLLYISGQIGNKEDDYNEIVAGGIRPQVNQAMKNINNILLKHNATMDNIVKCTCILVNGDDWGAMSEEYVKYFKKNKPARTTFGGADLGDGILVELDCISKLN